MKSILQVVENLLKPYIDDKDDALNNALTNNTKAVEGLIARVETGPNYSASMTKNARFIMNDFLYRVTASSVNTSTPINTGTGGNAERVTTGVANSPFLPSTRAITKSSKVTGTANCVVVGVIVQVDLELSPTSGQTLAANGETILSGLPTPANATLYTNLVTISGQDIPCVITSSGDLKTYYANESWSTGRVDASIVYIATRESL